MPEEIKLMTVGLDNMATGDDQPASPDTTGLVIAFIVVAIILCYVINHRLQDWYCSRHEFNVPPQPLLVVHPEEARSPEIELGVREYFQPNVVVIHHTV